MVYVATFCFFGKCRKIYHPWILGDWSYELKKVNLQKLKMHVPLKSSIGEDVNVPLTTSVDQIEKKLDDQQKTTV